MVVDPLLHVLAMFDRALALALRLSAVELLLLLSLLIAGLEILDKVGLAVDVLDPLPNLVLFLAQQLETVVHGLLLLLALLSLLLEAD